MTMRLEGERGGKKKEKKKAGRGRSPEELSG
jgi:hypothetical protein